MSKIEREFACPICCEVMPQEFCPQHPDEIMDLTPPGQYVLELNKGRYNIFQWDDNFEYTQVVCQITDGEPLGESTGERVVAVLEACHDISNEALDAGYIQTLQDLPSLVDAYLTSPDKLSSLRLTKQLARVRARNKVEEE